MRIALQDFTTTRNSYWAGREAAAFTAGLQAMLPGDGRIEWVDRSEFAAAANEMALSRWAVADDASRLQLGHWLRADFMVIGHFHEPEDEPKRLTLEIVEVSRADAIVQRELVYENNSSLSASDMAGIVDAILEMIAATRAIVKADADRPVIAPVVFANSDVSRRLDQWEGRVAEIWRELAREGDEVRVLNLTRTRDAEEEERLSLLGLTAEGAWRETADVYVWGEYEEVEYADRPFEEVVVEFRVHLWSGANDLVTITRRAKVREMESLIADLGREVFSHARAGGVTEATAARRAAEKLDEQARRIAGRGASARNRQVPPGQKRALDLYRQTLLELGRFLDPDDPERAWEVASFKVGQNRESFPAAARRAQEMMDWCHRHLVDLTDRRAAQRLRQAISAWAEVPALLDFDDSRRSRPGVPGDTPPTVIAEWRREIEERFVIEAESWVRYPVEHSRLSRPFVSELYRGLETISDPRLRLRLLRATEDIYHAAVARSRREAAELSPHAAPHHLSWIAEYQVPILRVFMDLGVPEEGVRWLQMDLSEAGRPPAVASKAENIERTGIANERVSRPTLFPRNPDRPKVSWEQWRKPRRPTFTENGVETRPMAFPFKRPVGPAIQPDRFHRPAGLEYDHIVTRGPYVWLAGRRLTYHHLPPFPSQLNQRPSPQETNTVLVRYDRRLSRFEEIALPENISSKIAGMTFQGDDLWLITSGEGAIRRDGATGEWTHFRAADGLISDNLRDIAVMEGRIAFVAEGSVNRLIGFYHPETGEWMREDFSSAEGLRSLTHIEVSGDWALLLGLTPHLLHVPSGRLTNLTNSLRKIFGETYPHLNAVAGSDGFWLVTIQGTFFFSPATSMEFKKVHSLKGQTRMAAADGKFLWIARPGGAGGPGALGGKLLVINREWPDWIGSAPLAMPPLAVAADDQSVWLAVGHPDHPAWEFQKPPLMQWRSEPEGPSKTIGAQEDAPALLLEAIVNGEENAVRLLLEAGADPNRTADWDDAPTPLIAAAERNRAGIVERLLRAGARIESRGKRGQTALIAAARAGAKEVLQVLCDAGANVDAQDEERWTALHFAALHQFVEGIRILIDHGANPSVTVTNRMTPLTLALAVRAEETAFLLLAGGATAEGEDGALSQAVQLRNPDLVRAMLERDALVNAGRYLAFSNAVGSGNREIIQAFFDHGYNPAIEDHEGKPVGQSALATAVRGDEDWVVKELLRRGLNPNLSGFQGLPLELAVERKNATAVRLLLEAGADPLLPDRQKRRIIDAAPEGEIRDLLQAHLPAKSEAETRMDEPEDYPSYRRNIRRPLDYLLAEGLFQGYNDLAFRALRAGADPDSDTNGWPAIVLAAALEDPAMVRELIARGADINATVDLSSSSQSGGFSALHQAVVRDNRDVARALLEHDVLFGIGGRGKSAIKMAEERKRAALLEMFLNLPNRSLANAAVSAAIHSGSMDDLRTAIAKSPDLNLPDPDFRTPLGFALSHPWHRTPAVELLLKEGADPNRRDPKAGAPPLLQAISAQRSAVDKVRLLLEHGADPTAVDDNGEGIAEYLELVTNRPMRDQLRGLIDEFVGRGISEARKGGDDEE